MKKYDAIILAGEKEGAIPVIEKNKAFLDFRGRKLIFWVIDALCRTESIQSITVVGPRNELVSEFGGHDFSLPVSVIEQGDNIFDNIWRGSLNAFAEYREGAPVSELRSSPLADKAVVTFTSDIPFLEPEEVDHFLGSAPLDRADIIFGMTSQRLLSPFEAGPGKPGIKYLYYCTREDILRHSNMVLIRPLKMARLLEVQVPIIYRLRYQRRFSNVVAAFREALRFMTPAMFPYFALLQLAKSLHRDKFYRLRDLVRRPLYLHKLERTASRIFQTRFSINRTVSVGPTLDVDDEECYDLMDSHYERWKEIQTRQIKEALDANKQ